MRQRDISAAVIRRLPRYYRYLGELLQNDVVRISSKELSQRMKVTASQIRQDLNNFGGFGQQGYGYNVEYLHSEIGKILGLDVQHNMIIIGAGNLGQALANYNFEKVGYHLIGIFDTNPRLKGVSVRGIEVRMMDSLDEFVATTQGRCGDADRTETPGRGNRKTFGAYRHQSHLEFCADRSECIGGCLR